MKKEGAKKEGGMKAEQILREFAAQAGWDPASMIAVVLDYIDSLDGSGTGEGIGIRPSR